MLEYLIVTVFIALPMIFVLNFLLNSLAKIYNILDFLLKIPVL